jgi:hypothetical protein
LASSSGSVTKHHLVAALPKEQKSFPEKANYISTPISTGVGHPTSRIGLKVNLLEVSPVCAEPTTKKMSPSNGILRLNKRLNRRGEFVLVNKQIALEPLGKTRTQDFHESVPSIPLVEALVAEVMKELTPPSHNGRRTAPEYMI